MGRGPSMVTRGARSALDQTGRAGNARRQAPADACAAGRTRAIKRLDLVEQEFDLRGVGRLRGKAQPNVGCVAARRTSASPCQPRAR